MIRNKSLSIAALLVLAAILFSALCCGTATLGGSTQTPVVEVTKVKPSVVSVNVVNTGTQDAYYAILDITIKNDGADGMVIVLGSIMQGTQTTTSELPTYITRNSEIVVRMVLPLKWGGGEPQAKAEVRIP